VLDRLGYLDAVHRPQFPNSECRRFASLKRARNIILLSRANRQKRVDETFRELIRTLNSIGSALRDNLGEEYAAIRPVVEIYPLELTPRLEHEAAGSGRRLFHSDGSGGTSRIFLMARDRSIAFSAEAIAACLLCA
jgi:hypothetical protein